MPASDKFTYERLSLILQAQHIEAPHNTCLPLEHGARLSHYSLSVFLANELNAEWQIKNINTENDYLSGARVKKPISPSPFLNSIPS
jgi:hypothetical protein